MFFKVLKAYFDCLGCSATPCTLIKGKPSTWRIKFKSNVDTASMTIKASGILLGLAGKQS
jgi:hypothetical protein